MTRGVDSAPSAGDRRVSSAEWIVAVALTAILGLPLIRVFMALLYGVRETSSDLAAVSIAAGVFVTPIAWALVRRSLGTPLAVGAAVGGLVLASLGVQFVHPIPWWIAGTGVASALGAWTLLLVLARSDDPSHRPLGGATFAVGFVLGLAVDGAVHASFRTWDAAWQVSPAARSVTVALSLASVATLPMLAKVARSAAREGRLRDVAPVVALGPFLVLQALFLHVVAFVDAAGNVSIAVGAATVLAGASASLMGVVWGIVTASTVARIVGTVALGAIAAVLPVSRGPVVLLAVIVGSALCGWLLAAALEPRGQSRHTSAWRTGAAMAIGGVAFVSIVFAFQIDPSQPLPFPDELLPVLAAGLLGAGAIAGAPPQPAQQSRRAIVGVALALTLAIPTFLVVSHPAPMSALPETPERSLRVVSWNVHSAVDADGQVVPEELARTIAGQHPDVVVLQEVSRGWPIGGALDIAEWLSTRLSMPFVWGPAADTRFGNVVMSRAPIVGADEVALPFGSGPQRRSLIRVMLDVRGSPLTVAGTHLETGPGTDTRARQIDVVLQAVAGEPRTIVAGDMNMQPTDDDVALFSLAGFRSAQDEAGDRAASTARDPDFPGDRPDWIFGSADLTFSGFEIVPSDASDHLPIAVTVTW